jgi:hypothetical protein
MRGQGCDHPKDVGSAVDNGLTTYDRLVAEG